MTPNQENRKQVPPQVPPQVRGQVLPPKPMLLLVHQTTTTKADGSEIGGDRKHFFAYDYL